MAGAAPAIAQAPPRLAFGLHLVPVATRVDPVPGGRPLAEVRIAQPTAMVHAGALGGRLRLVGMVDFEGLTMPGGELAPGAWGEGFIDRRHPHTYLHELVVSGVDLLGELDGPARVSLSLGKGFAPFGTDDPMVRPPVRYPVNHHLAQILERAVLIGAVRTGAVGLEAGLFNGDEPERPGQWPRIGGRFGDSWALRVTAGPAPGLEGQASYAHVRSPEHRPGSGVDQEKWSASVRWARTVGGRPLYALVEWARTSEAQGFFVHRSVLAEGAWTVGRHRVHYRFERTERPEEERGLDPFRSTRPHLENSTIGTTRWTIHTVGYTFQSGRGGRGWRVHPFVEGSVGRVAAVGGGLFDPESHYGRTDLWALSLGARLGWGARLHRMGRYGAAEAPERADHQEHGRGG